MVLFFVYHFIVRNVLTYLSYKKKFGDKLVFMFYPLLGNFGISRKSFKEHGDSLYTMKNIMRTKPQAKAVIIFNGFVMQVIILDT